MWSETLLFHAVFSSYDIQLTLLTVVFGGYNYMIPVHFCGTMYLLCLWIFFSIAELKYLMPCDEKTVELKIVIKNVLSLAVCVDILYTIRNLKHQIYVLSE